MATIEQINQLKKQYPNFPWATASQDVVNTFVASKLGTASQAGTSMIVKILLVGAAVGIILFFRKKK